MRLAADECCDALLVAALRQAGHDVWYVMESARGMADESILGQAVADQRILLTEDKDFGELAVRLGLPAYGILLLRMGSSDSEAKSARLLEVLREHGERLAGSFVVVDRWKTRFRFLHSP